MSEPAQLPSEQERQDFARKLREFRATLPATEQRMLDAAVVAAFAPAAEGDVQGTSGSTVLSSTSPPRLARTPHGTTAAGRPRGIGPSGVPCTSTYLTTVPENSTALHTAWAGQAGPPRLSLPP